jgi:hypothetical protein
MDSERYCLRWNNHHSNIISVFSQLLTDEHLVDVTLVCEGSSLRAHKMVLSACSSYFQKLFSDHPEGHPIVILKDFKFSELKKLIEFIYKGEVNVEYSQLSTLLHTAKILCVKGLVEMSPSAESSFENVSTGSSILALIPDKTVERPPSPQKHPQEFRDSSMPSSNSESDDNNVSYYIIYFQIYNVEKCKKKRCD